MSLMRRARLGPGALGAVVRRPALWGTALAQARAFVPRRWWAHWPPLPLPAEGYMAFRSETMFGAADGCLDGEQLVAYLEWCRRMRLSAR
ncbi:MAG TPA: hypothetical protein VL984_11340 [Acidimicrobiales bacterium]|nr:hypothetical protein [Acidimicrobiales bacterium]